MPVNIKLEMNSSQVQRTTRFKKLKDFTLEEIKNIYLNGEEESQCFGQVELDNCQIEDLIFRKEILHIVSESCFYRFLGFVSLVEIINERSFSENRV